MFYLLKNVKFYFLFYCVSVIYVFMILFFENFFWYIQNLMYICNVFKREHRVLKNIKLLNYHFINI